MAIPSRSRYLVHPNPWCSLDREGRAAGVAHVDPDLFGTTMIGADVADVEMLDKWSTKKTALMHGLGIAPRQVTRYRFKTEPINVQGDGNAGTIIRRKIQNGELFAADAATAKAAGVKLLPYAAALAGARAQAAARFDAFHGPGAFELAQQALAAEGAPPPGPTPDATQDDTGSEMDPTKTIGRGKAARKGD
jgi:hypothetical protein